MYLDESVCDRRAKVSKKERMYRKEEFIGDE
jgi:hypothetical protein